MSDKFVSFGSRVSAIVPAAHVTKTTLIRVKAVSKRWVLKKKLGYEDSFVSWRRETQKPETIGEKIQKNITGVKMAL